MKYTQLLPSDKPPFPYAKDKNGAYPNMAYPTGVLSFDSEMQEYYIKVLQAAQKIDSTATISNDVGMVVVSTKDKSLMLTGGLYDEYQLGLATVELQLGRSGILPPAPVVETKPNVDSGPIRDVPFEDPAGSDNWFKLSGPFYLKVRCKPPLDTVPTNQAAVNKAKIIDQIQVLLVAEPIKSQETVDVLLDLAEFVGGLKA